MFGQWILIAWAGGLAYEDWRWRRISNVLLAGGLILGLAHWQAYDSMPMGIPLFQGALAAVLGLALTLPFYLAGWMGAGDVKLCAVIGWLGGMQVLLATCLVGCMAGGLLAVMLRVPGCLRLMSSRRLDPRLRERVPFGVGLAIALIGLASGWIDLALFQLRQW